MTYVIGTVAVAAVIFGITEALKEFGITGKASRLVVFVLGVIFVGLAAANEAALIPPDTMQYVNLAVGCCRIPTPVRAAVISPPPTPADVRQEHLQERPRARQRHVAVCARRLAK